MSTVNKIHETVTSLDPLIWIIPNRFGLSKDYFGGNLQFVLKIERIRVKSRAPCQGGNRSDATVSKIHIYHVIKIDQDLGTSKSISLMAVVRSFFIISVWEKDK